MMKKQKALVAMTVVGAVLGGLATPSFAEGSWNSFIAGALTDFQSRTWTDNNTDAANTVITFTGCTDDNHGGAPTTAGVELRRVRSLLPDVSLGSKVLCNAAGNWGRVASGTYKFRINTIGGQGKGNRITVTTVSTSY